MKKLLICCSVGNPHIIKILRSIREGNISVKIYFLSPSFVKKENIDGIKDLVDYLYYLKEPKVNVGFIKKIIQFWKLFMLRFSLDEQYDCIIIHAITLKYLAIFNILRKKAKKLVLVPWGSEVLRADNKSLFFLRKWYNKCDYIGTLKYSRFESNIKEILKLSDCCKIVNLQPGSIIIDLLIKVQLSKEEAKKRWGFQGKTVITCGYNGYITQNHLAIIDQLYDAKSSLGSNIQLVFPVTYGLSDDYKSKILSKINATGFKATLITEILSVEKLYELQCATDFFIHLQKTDASCSSVKEYILAGATVINGAWLSYPEIERHGIPYFSIEKISDLSSKIKSIFDNHEKILLSKEMYNDIAAFSYTNSVIDQTKTIINWLS